MDQISVTSIIFVSVPEAIIICVLGILAIGKFTFLKNKFSWIRIIISACIFAASSFFIRRLEISENEMLFIDIVIISLLFIFIMRFKLYEAFLSATFGLVLLIITQTPCILIASSITGHSLPAVQSDDSLRILFSIPSILFQTLLSLLSFRFKFKILDLERITNRKKEYYVQLFAYIVTSITLVTLTITMAKVLLFDQGNTLTVTNSLLLRVNTYLSIFVTVALTLAIRSTHEYYKAKNKLNNAEFIQNIDYITGLINENNIDEAKNTLKNLKAHLSDR